MNIRAIVCTVGGAALLIATGTAQAGETIERSRETVESHSMKVETVPPPPPVVEKHSTVQQESRRVENKAGGTQEHETYESEKRVETRTPPPPAPTVIEKRTETVIEDD